MSNNDFEEAREEIAVIGMSGRFPGARNLDEFWRNLCDGVESITFFTDEELQASAEAPGRVRAGGVLKDVELFDASFFGFTPREAEITDPQHRLFMECAWEALEQAGCVTQSDAERVGVFAGASLNSYWMNLMSNRDLSASLDAMQVMIGNEKDHLPTLVSYKLNLRGPSINVQTACSTSLVAVSLACQSLLSYQCDVALAGAASINLRARQGYEYREGGVLSPDGHCRAFDAAAQGTVGGDGVGVVVLKRLSEALAGGDDIQAVIKGSAVNNDGALRVGYTAPGVEGQAEVIAEALSVAGVEPETIAYIEAHGTGTPLGDPIEVAALTKVYGPRLREKRRCALGSVKTNIGHLNTAAGVAGLIKTVLALKHRAIPPSLHFKSPNPKIDFDNSPFYVGTSLSAWRKRDVPRRAGVSSFGIGGTNAHLVLEEAPRRESPGHGRSAHLLTLSARTGTALETMTADLAAYLKQHRDANLADVAYTLQVGRKVFNHRRALVCSDIEEAIRALEGDGPARALTDVHEHRGRNVVMLFPGQGAQYVNMARGLYESEQTFRRHVAHCAERLQPLLGVDLREVLFPEETSLDEAARRLGQTSITQPALFVVEYALAQLWMEWGVRPAAMLGHSVGEYVAACLAGVFSLEDALTLVAVRGRLMQQLPAGAMLGVRLAGDELSPLLGSELSLAAVNSPTQCVASGPREALERLAAELSAKGVASSFLPAAHAFHSRMVEPILQAFTEQVGKIKLNPPRIPYLSNVTGGWITDRETTDPHYWAAQLRRAVRFADGAAELLKDEESVLLEVGPGRALCGMVRAFPEQDTGRRSFSSLRHAQENVPDGKQLLDALGRLWLAGVKIDWRRFYGDERRLRLSLPTYPFERQRFWVEADARPDEQQNTRAESGRKTDTADLFSVPVWKQSVQARQSVGRDAGVKKSCLVFLDACGVGAAMVERLRDAGGDVVSVSAGEGFEQVSESQFVIDPRREEDFDALLGRLSQSARYPELMLHLWGVTTEKHSSSVNDKIERALEACFDGLVCLARAHSKHGLERRAKIVVVTNNAHSVTGEEQVEPGKALAQGLCRTLAREYPRIACRLVDIVVPPDGGALTSLTSRLVGECFRESEEASVAYRGAHRWTRVFEPLRLEESRGNVSTLREGGVYLLTGARDDFQLRLAEYLTRTVNARPVFLCDAPPGDEVAFVNADMTDAAALRRALREVRERFGKIEGVFHATARPGAEMLQFKKSSGALASAVKSAATLKEALRDEPPAFMVLHSSTAAQTGAFGQADYCAAHAFHDALAHARGRGDETPVLSVAWGLTQWADWRDSVAGLFPESQDALAERRAEYGLTFEEGFEALARLLPTSLPQVLVSAQDVQTIFREQDALAPDVRLQTNEERPAARRYNPRLAGEYAAPRNETEYVLAGIFQEVFGLNQVGIHDNFFDLGGNSLFGIQLMARLRKTFQTDLPMNHLFTSPTVAGLAAIITEHRPGQGELDEVERMLREIESLSAEDVELRLSDDDCAASEAACEERGSFDDEHADEGMKFSLFFFSDDGAKQTSDKYRLLLDTARYADENGFRAVWTPERHFQEFGGLYPNPSVLGAALAVTTRRLQIRAGSVALPLHNPVRVAEEWSVVDNLSQGRVGISVASGWHPLDFVLQPGSYANRKDLMFQSIQTVRRLWRGESVTLEGVDGGAVSVRTLPRPVQAELPVWVTIAGSRHSWVKAGEIGANVLTAILREPLSVLEEKIKSYREARAQHGHDPAAGEVAVMLHTFVGEDDRVVKEQVRGPLCDYFRTNIKQLGLQKEFFMARQGMDSSLDVESMIESDLDSIVSFAFERYYNTTLLCGTPDKCAGLVERLSAVGVNEVACLIDFGLSHELVMESLGHLAGLQERYRRQPLAAHATV